MKSILTLIFTLTLLSGMAQVCPTNTANPKVLLAGDSWAQYMSDDGTHNKIFDKFGHADKDLLGASLGSDPGPGYTGTEYAISGSEANQWADKANYPWIQNVIDEISANPSIETVILSIGGNDILAGRSGGGWYHNMDNDVAGSEAALFNTIRDNTFVIIDDILAVHPDIKILISSYDYPNFDVSALFCGLYACPKRRDLSFSDTSPLITDAELNQMMISVESERTTWLGLNSALHYDNSIGLSHYYYGDGNSAAGTLPLPEALPPFSATFYGGDTNNPTLRSNFRAAFDPIHLDADAYEYKIINQTLNYFMSKFRENINTTISSNGGTEDGWTTGNSTGTGAMRVGDNNASQSYKGILSFDTGSLPDDAIIESVNLYMIRNGISNSNPFTSGLLGSPQIDMKTGEFGAIGVENSDYSAAADATDAGCFHGTVSQNDFALRIDLDVAGMAALNKLGNTQFRISFPTSDAASDFIDFNTGNAVVDGDFLTVGLAEFMGDARPFLDIQYRLPLPVELISFEARKENDKVRLDWSAALEDNFFGYEVQHSVDGENWNVLETIEGRGVGNYFTYHNQPAPANNYYRLKMIDLDGSFEYSDIRPIFFETKGKEFAIFPNPFFNQFSIQSYDEGDLRMVLIDPMGRIVLEKELGYSSGSGEVFNINLSNVSISPGVYSVQIHNEHTVKSFRVVKARL